MSFQAWLDIVCCPDPTDGPPFFVNNPDVDCLDSTEDVCHECVDGVITGYRYRTAGGPWIYV